MQEAVNQLLDAHNLWLRMHDEVVKTSLALLAQLVLLPICESAM